MKRISNRPRATFALSIRGRLAVMGLAGLTGVLAACSAPSSKRGDDTEQCYRHGTLRTCTAAQPATPSQISAVYRMSFPPMDRGRLLVVRNDWADAHGHAVVRMNGQVLSDTIPCSVFAVDVPPGIHRLRINPAASGEPVSIDVGPGQLRAIKAVRNGQGGPKGFSLVPIGAGEARSLVQECRVLGLLDRTAGPKSPTD